MSGSQAPGANRDTKHTFDHSALSFRNLTAADKKPMLEIAAKIWGGDDYLFRVYDHWIDRLEAPFIGMFAEDILIGCGRLSLLTSTAGWLEALRIDPQHQQQGLGRLIGIKMIEVAREKGFQELYFSTYIHNTGSIRINEAIGFSKIATYTTLNLKLDQLVKAPTISADHPELSVTSEVYRSKEITWNGWLFLPPKTIELERFFPGVQTIRSGDSVMMIADNNKSPERMLEICWLEGPDATSNGLCLKFAIAEAGRRGQSLVHLMLPAAIPHEPFLEAGFSVYEQALDVFLYRGVVNELSWD